MRPEFFSIAFCSESATPASRSCRYVDFDAKKKSKERSSQDRRDVHVRLSRPNVCRGGLRDACRRQVVHEQTETNPTARQTHYYGILPYYLDFACRSCVPRSARPPSGAAKRVSKPGLNRCNSGAPSGRRETELQDVVGMPTLNG